MSELLQAARTFWYNNEPGDFSLYPFAISRPAIQIYGGPSVRFNACPICQRSEWTSRITQTNQFEPHFCATSEDCRMRCARQGDDRWTHFHQDFSFAFTSDPELNAPHCAALLMNATHEKMFSNVCDQTTGNLCRQLAQSCQVDFIIDDTSVDWSKYDFAFMICRGNHVRRSRPDIPVIMYGHDLWKQPGALQRDIDYVQPDIFLTPFPTSWKEKYRFPSRTQFRFYCLSASTFFSRPNMEPGNGDLLVTGIAKSSIYEPRAALDAYIELLEKEYDITFWHFPGCKRNSYAGQLGGDARYLNKWSEFLGSFKYVLFGRIADTIQPTFIKHYEFLASGAIPIFPESPDFSYLGIEPMVHYVPLFQAVRSRYGDRLRHFLSYYPEYAYIAENAVRWHNENADRMLFDDFEDLIREITQEKYPRRLKL